VSGAENPPAYAGLELLNLEIFDTLLEAQDTAQPDFPIT